MQIPLEPPAFSDYSLNWRVTHGKARSSLVGGIKEKYKPAGARQS